MKRLQRFSWICFLLLVGLVPSAWGADWGGSIDNATEIAHETEVLPSQRNRVALWGSYDSGSWFSVFGQGSYVYSLDRPYLFDVDELWAEAELGLGAPDTLKSSEPGGLAFNARLGRFFMREFSGYVLDHRVDGLRVSLATRWGRLRAGAGYTGLLLKPTSDIELSKLDTADDAKVDVRVAPSRLVEQLEITLAEVLLRQDVVLSAVLQQDLRPKDETRDDRGRVDTQYYGLGLAGPVWRNLFHETFGYVGTGSMLSGQAGVFEREPILSWLAGGTLRYLLPTFLQSYIELSGVYASGDADHQTFLEGNAQDRSTVFLPISGQEPGLVFAPVVGNLAYGRIAFSAKPFAATLGEPTPLSLSPSDTGLSSLQVIAETFVFFRPTTGPISEPGLNDASDAAYLGTEVDLRVQARLLSDLGMALSSGVFVPNTGEVSGFETTEDPAFRADAQDVQLLTRLELSVSF
jgi:hypothetical protein